MENPVEKAVNEATSEALQMPDSKLMKQVADLVNQRADLPKLAAQAIGKRLMQLRNHKVQALTMELIEYLAFTCETPFFTQIATNDFLQRINTLLNPNMNPQMQQRLLQVIFVLKQLMQPHQDLFPTFFQFLQKIKMPLPTSYESKYVALRRPQSHGGSKGGPVGIPDNTKNAKLKRDLEIVKSNIYLTNEIIDNSNPLDDQSKNEILRDMVSTLKGVEEKLRNLITNMSGNDESMMSYCLELNDDLQKTFERYETLKRRQKPAPFKPEQFKFSAPAQPQQAASGDQQIPPNGIPFGGPPQSQPFGQQPSVFSQQSAPPPPQPKPKPIDLMDLFEDPSPVPAQQQPLQQQIQPPPIKVEQKMPNLFDLDDPEPIKPPVQATNPPYQPPAQLLNEIDVFSNPQPPKVQQQPPPQPTMNPLLQQAFPPVGSMQPQGPYGNQFQQMPPGFQQYQSQIPPQHQQPFQNPQGFIPTQQPIYHQQPYPQQLPYPQQQMGYQQQPAQMGYSGFQMAQGFGSVGQPGMGGPVQGGYGKPQPPQPAGYGQPLPYQATQPPQGSKGNQNEFEDIVQLAMKTNKTTDLV